MKAIIIGAGFSGAACARRLAENGFRVTVLEKNDTIGGNAYDEYKNGAYVHKYGPHIFHTEKQDVFAFLSRFTEWFSYEHRVLANVNGTYIPVPFNLESLHKTFPREKADKLENILKREYGEGKKVPILELKNNPDEDVREFAEFVFENVFRFYTQKQWGRKIEDLDPAVMRRVPVYVSREDRYFTDKFQFQPKNGFTALFEKMLDHENISVELGGDALSRLEIRDDGVYFDGTKTDDTVVYTGQADELLNYRFGKLPYRSLRF
ncbi:MAG: UDP-galactopyranose mutase, partial [Bacillota bacterium]